MKAMVLSILCGTSSAATALACVAASGPCDDMQLCRLTPPGAKPPALASYWPWISPMNSLMTLRWHQGGRKLCSATIQRGGKMTKSALAVPGLSEGAGSTVKIDGAGWSKLAVLIVLKRARSYLHGARLPGQATTSSGE